jgi:hypothetical protein
MRVLQRLAFLTVLATTCSATVAEAIPINVAEFQWATILDPGLPCPDAVEDPACVPSDPLTLSIFTLTNIWDGPAPGPTLFDNRLSLPSGDLAFLDLDPAFPLNFNQLSEIGLPEFAAASVSFAFGADIITLGATLTQPDTFAVLQFDPVAAPVPEPGTLALLMTGGAAALVRRRRPRM